MQELAVLAARAVSTQRQFAATADNVANANTHGYRRLDVDFKELVSRKTAGSNDLTGTSYVADRGTYLVQEQGGMEQTGSQLNAAIQGQGFFAVDINGTKAYTRDGSFLVNQDGTLTNTSGNPVLDNAGAQIQLPQDAKKIMIARDGTVSTEQGQLAQIGVFEFSKEDTATFTRMGQNNYLPGAKATPVAAENPTVMQGYLETSNVNAVQEMTNLQTVSKAYQASIKTLSNLEDTEQRMVRTLGNLQ